MLNSGESVTHKYTANAQAAITVLRTNLEATHYKSSATKDTAANEGTDRLKGIKASKTQSIKCPWLNGLD